MTAARTLTTVTRMSTLPFGTLATAWQLYNESFAHVNAHTAQRHLLTEEEFVDIMLDARIDKHLIFDTEGAVAGLGVCTNRLEAWPLISPAYFERIAPAEFKAGQVWYCGFVCTTRKRRGHFVPLLRSMVDASIARTDQPAPVWYLDFCGYNERTLRMSELIIKSLARNFPHVRGEQVDQQTFWGYTFDGQAVPR